MFTSVTGRRMVKGIHHPVWRSVKLLRTKSSIASFGVSREIGGVEKATRTTSPISSALLSPVEAERGCIRPRHFSTISSSPRHVTAESACRSRVVKSWKTAKEPGGAAAAAEGSRPGCGICVALAAAQLSTNSQSSLQAQLLSFNQGKSLKKCYQAM